MGYRYFETIAGAKEKVNYPFGFGLSYTEFRMEIAECNFEEKETVVFVKVTNIGERAGKEVVQVYYSAPQGLLGKPARELAAFQKTRLLGRGESQMLRLTIPYSRMAFTMIAVKYVSLPTYWKKKDATVSMWGTAWHRCRKQVYGTFQRTELWSSCLQKQVPAV